MYAQTNNAGSLGDGNVVTAINVDTGLKSWQSGYAYPDDPRRRRRHHCSSATGIPGGAVGVDKTLSGYLSDLVYATLYGDLWEVDPATGLSRYAAGTLPAAGNPLLRFSTDMHAIGAQPGDLLAVGGRHAVRGDRRRAATPTTIRTTRRGPPRRPPQYALGVNLATPTADAIINENKGTTGVVTSDIPIKFTLGAGEAGYAEVTVIDGQLDVTTDTGDVNNSAVYGTGGATGHVDVLRDQRRGTDDRRAARRWCELGGRLGHDGLQRRLERDRNSSRRRSDRHGGNAVEATAAKVTRRLWLRTR